MRPDRIADLLAAVRDGQLEIAEALEALARLPFADIGDAAVDHHRALRTGFPEVVLGAPKTPDQIVRIASEIARGGCNVLVTRVSPDKADAVRALLPELEHHPGARALVLRQCEIEPAGGGPIPVVTAGTGDLPVAEEAALTVELAGGEVLRVNDVGVAGVHRLLHRLEDLRRAPVIVAVAGMEGALPSVIGGLVACPVIAVPTSVGYGVALGGFTALFGMLTSCAAGITVVNIDNGFGAGYAAAMISRIGQRAGERR